MKYIIDNFMHPKDAKSFISFFDKNEHLCFDTVEFHKERNIHYDNINDENIKNLLEYYAKKNIFFIDHYFKTKTTLWGPPGVKNIWSNMRLCRWKKDHHMPLHIDRQPLGGDTMDYSSLVYLNDNYTGGKLRFLEGKKEVKLKMKAFSCIIFPSGKEYSHGVEKIIKGKRYTIPSWYTKLSR
tara:strand:+ start:65 stop:610 length:546 start_codon:yes stop_codon:yes gene_type:complete